MPLWGEHRSTLAAIAAGGSLGGPSRYLLGRAFPAGHGAFPVTTLVINVTGSFLLTLITILLAELRPGSRNARPFFAVGFLGAYTTFSTWMVDSAMLLAGRQYGLGALNLLGALFVGLAASSLGLTTGRAVVAARRRRGRHRRAGREAPDVSPARALADRGAR